MGQLQKLYTLDVAWVYCLTTWNFFFAEKNAFFAETVSRFGSKINSGLKKPVEKKERAFAFLFEINHLSCNLTCLK